jgi:GTP pyrophosphokinase
VSRFTFEMAEAKHLANLLRSIKGIDGVYDAFRVHSDN